MTNVENFLVKTTLTVVGILTALCLAEVGAKIYVEKFAAPHNFERFASAAQLKAAGYSAGAKAHRYLGFIPAPGYTKGQNRHNQMGFRGADFPREKPAGEYRIVCLGASTTYGTGVNDYRHSYPYLLQEILANNGYDQVRVINAGVMAYTSWEILLNFQLRVMELQPDLVILYLGINDVDARLVWPESAYKGDNSGYLLAPGMARHTTGLFAHFNLGRVFLAKWYGYTLNDLGRNYTLTSGSYRGDEFKRQTFEHTYPDGFFLQIPAEKILKSNPPVFFQRNIDHLTGLATNQGIDVLLTSLALCPAKMDQLDPEGKQIILDGLREHHRILKAISEERQVHFFDLAAVFPAEEKYYRDPAHLNKDGNLRKASLMAEFLISSRVLDQ